MDTFHIPYAPVGAIFTCDKYNSIADNFPQIHLMVHLLWTHMFLNLKALLVVSLELVYAKICVLIKLDILSERGFSSLLKNGMTCKKMLMS